MGKRDLTTLTGFAPFPVRWSEGKLCCECLLTPKWIKLRPLWDYRQSRYSWQGTRCSVSAAPQIARAPCEAQAWCQKVDARHFTVFNRFSLKCAALIYFNSRATVVNHGGSVMHINSMTWMHFSYYWHNVFAEPCSFFTVNSSNETPLYMLPFFFLSLSPTHT